MLKECRIRRTKLIAQAIFTICFYFFIFQCDHYTIHWIGRRATGNSILFQKRLIQYEYIYQDGLTPNNKDLPTTRLNFPVCRQMHFQKESSQTISRLRHTFEDNLFKFFNFQLLFSKISHSLILTQPTFICSALFETGTSHSEEDIFRCQCRPISVF